MNFEIGQKIKVLDSDKWVCGTFLDEMQCNLAMVKVRGQNQIYDISKIRNHITFDRNPDGSCPELDQFASKYWEPLKRIVTLGVDKLLSSHSLKLEFDEEEHSISVDGWISITLGTKELKSILGFMEQSTWYVSIAAPIAGTYWEPPDVDVVEIGECPNVIGVAELFINTIWKEMNRGFWDAADETEPPV